MKKYLIVLLFCSPTFAVPKTHALSINGAGTSITCNTHTVSNATLAGLKAAETWEAGDDIVCTANGTVEWDAGTGSGLALMGASSADWFTFDGGGAVFYDNVTASNTGVFTINSVSGCLLKNVKVKNTHASAPTHDICIYAQTANCNAVIVKDSYLQQSTFTGYTSAAHLSIVQIQSGTDYNVYAAIENVYGVFDTANNLRPVVNIIDSATGGITPRGRVYLTDCTMGGIGTEGTDAGDDVVGVSGSYDVVVNGGLYGPSEASCLTMYGAAFNYGRIFAYNVTAFGDNYGAVSTTHRACIVASVIDNCYAYDVLNGFTLQIYTPTAPQTPVVIHEPAICRKSTAIRSLNRNLTGGSAGANACGVRVRNAIITNCNFYGFNVEQTGPVSDYGVLDESSLSSPDYTSRTGSLVVKNCLFDQCRRGVECNARMKFMDIDNNTFIFTGTVALADSYAFYGGGIDANLKACIRIANNIFKWSPTTNDAYYPVIPLNHFVQDPTSGYNHLYYNNTGAWYTAGGWTVSSSTDINSNSAAQIPTFDGAMRSATDSPALKRGKSELDQAFPEVKPINFVACRVASDMTNAANNVVSIVKVDVAATSYCTALTGLTADITGTANAAQYMTLLALTGECAGQYRAINASTTAGVLTCDMPFWCPTTAAYTFNKAGKPADCEVGPADSRDQFLILPAMRPRNGFVGGYYGGTFIQQAGLYSENCDAFDRIQPMYAVENVATTGGLLTLGRRAAGCLIPTPSQASPSKMFDFGGL